MPEAWRVSARLTEVAWTLISTWVAVGWGMGASVTRVHFPLMDLMARIIVAVIKLAPVLLTVVLSSDPCTSRQRYTCKFVINIALVN